MVVFVKYTAAQCCAAKPLLLSDSSSPPDLLKEDVES